MEYVNLIVEFESFELETISRFLKKKKSEKIDFPEIWDRNYWTTFRTKIQTIIKENEVETKTSIMKAMIIKGILKDAENNAFSGLIKPHSQTVSKVKFNISTIPCKEYSLKWCCENMNSEQFFDHFVKIKKNVK